MTAERRRYAQERIDKLSKQIELLEDPDYAYNDGVDERRARIAAIASAKQALSYWQKLIEEDSRALHCST